MKLHILAFGAHPDDVELTCGGTVAAHTAMGKQVGIIDLTAGELGTRGNAQLRLEEARAAAQILGVSIRENLHFADGFFTNDAQHKLEVVKTLRTYMPDIVLAPALADRHPDHGRSAQLVAEACFLSGLAKIITHHPNGQQQAAWRPLAVYHYIQDTLHKPHFVTDISSFIEQKIASVQAYGSQFYNPQYQAQTNEAPTYISGKQFFEGIYARALEMARQTPFNYAEGFITTRAIGINNLFHIQ